MKKKIDSFMGKYRFLSNFWMCKIEMDGELYPSVEHAYQAAKTLDSMCRARVRECLKPGDAKRYGRHVNLRSDWEDVKFKVMSDLVEQKFTKHERLKQDLLATGNVQLIEGNTWHDTFWGIDKYTGDGENKLGKILMRVRQEIREDFFEEDD